MSEEIHNLLKIENDNTTFFTNKELKMIDDYINELEAYKYNMNRDYLRLEKENEELKKQLEEANEKILLLQASEPMLEYKNALEENQQKEFIEWLENEKNIYPNDISDYDYEDIINTILSKYNEIIGYVNE